MSRCWTICAALLLAAVGCNGRPQQGTLDWDRMRDQPRYDAYGSSTYFDDGAAMRRLPPGTIPADADEDPDVPASAREAAATSVPIAVTSDVLARGQNRYDIFCRPCHDLDGSANSPVARNMQLRQPPSLLDPAIRQLAVGRIYQALSDGYGLMPSYAHQLTPADRWAVVAYVRALQLRSGIPMASLPPSLRDEATRELGGAR